MAGAFLQHLKTGHQSPAPHPTLLLFPDQAVFVALGGRCGSPSPSEPGVPQSSGKGEGAEEGPAGAAEGMTAAAQALDSCIPRKPGVGRAEGQRPGNQCCQKDSRAFAGVPQHPCSGRALPWGKEQTPAPTGQAWQRGPGRSTTEGSKGWGKAGPGPGCEEQKPLVTWEKQYRT